MPIWMEDILQGPNLDEEFSDFLREQESVLFKDKSPERGERLSNSNGHL